MRMRDDKGIDDKMIAVPIDDPAFSTTSTSGAPAARPARMHRFFEDYKELEGKQVIVEDLLGADDALRIIREALELYRKLRRGELKTAHAG